MHPASRQLTHILKPSGSCALSLFIVQMLHFSKINYAVSVYNCVCRWMVKMIDLNLFNPTIWMANNLTASAFYWVRGVRLTFAFCNVSLLLRSNPLKPQPFFSMHILMLSVLWSMEGELQGNFNVNRQKQRDSGGGCLRLRPRS